MKIMKISYALLSSMMLAGTVAPSTITFGDTTQHTSTTESPTELQDTISESLASNVKTNTTSSLDEAMATYVELDNESTQFKISDAATSELTAAELQTLNSQINNINAQISTAISDGSVFAVTDPQSNVEYDYVNGKLELALNSRYSNGVTKLDFHWNFVRVYLSGAYLAVSIGTSVGQMAGSVIKRIVNAILPSVIKGGIYYDLNYLSLGVGSVGGLVGVGTDILVQAVTSWHWQ